MTPAQSAATVKPGLAELIGAFAESPQTLRRARLLGLSGWAYHVAARAGALGDVKPETVAAAVGFIAPEAVTDGWEAAAKATDPAQVANWHLHELREWGIAELGGYPRIGRLVELGRRVVEAVEPSALPLFAAWRAMSTPDDSLGAAAALVLLLLHEHRLGVHIVAVRAAGLTPLEAIVAGAEGETGAVAFGWQPPYPHPGPLLRRLVWAESVADSLAGQAYAILDVGERAEFVGLVQSLCARVSH